ncbi:MAG: HD-GYP domain-containing protein [Chitinispirillaceae bacterium]|nr:HD-GYP domain-containing protein [Chitinispirillaceae bacterium]
MLVRKKPPTIPLQDLKVGMYIGDVFNKKGVLLYSANTLITDESQIEALRRQGVDFVTITIKEKEPKDTEFKEEVITTFITEEIKPKAEASTKIYNEKVIREALDIRSKTVNAIRQIMTSAKSGRLFSLSSVVKNVEVILDFMLDNSDVMINLCRIKSQSESTYEHSVNVGILVTGFASALGFTREKVLDVGVGGLLHDIGKILLPDEVINKRGSYTNSEYELYRKHPLLGVEFIKNKNISVSECVSNIISQHHERLNGSGYPCGLKDKEIDEMAMICAVADVYDLLTTHGIHQRDYIPQEALALIFQGADIEYPRLLVEHFTKLLGIYPVGSFVKLDSGEMGVVIKNNRDKLLKPVVKILFSKDGKKLETPYIKDLAKEEEDREGNILSITTSLNPEKFNLTNSDISDLINNS